VSRGRALGFFLLKAVLILIVGAITVVLSVVASAYGLTPLLVAAALIALVVLKVRQSLRPGYVPRRSWRPLLVTGLVVIGFFVVISVVAAYWPK